VSLLQKNDWLFSGIAALILIVLIASNLWLMTMFLSMRILHIFIYIAGVIIILLTMTHISIYALGTRKFIQKDWIRNHLLFWIMTDLHTIIMIARYVHPNHRQGGLIPELFFLMHVFLIIPVYFSDRTIYYQKHELGLSFILHLSIYTLLSYSFIQLVIQTM
jgi:hypothetical protein